MKTSKLVATGMLGALGLASAIGLVGCGAEVGGPEGAIESTSQAIGINSLTASADNHRYGAFETVSSKILVFGGSIETGSNGSTSVEEMGFAAPSTATWTGTRSALGANRVESESMTFPGTDVSIVVGGKDAIAGNRLATTQLFDQSSNSRTNGPTSAVERYRTQIVPCGTAANQKALLIGGETTNNGVTDSLEVVTLTATGTPAASSATFVDGSSNTIKLKTARMRHSAVALDANTILVVGGDDGSTKLGSSELITVTDSCVAVTANYEVVGDKRVTKKTAVLPSSAVRTNGGLLAVALVKDETDYHATYYMGVDGSGLAETTFLFDKVSDTWAAGNNIPANKGRQRPPAFFNSSILGVAGGDVATTLGGTEASTASFVTFDPSGTSGGTWANGANDLDTPRVGNWVTYLDGTFLAGHGKNTTASATHEFDGMKNPE